MTLARQPITQGAHRLEPETLAARLAELPEPVQASANTAPATIFFNARIVITP